jgi:hypothetical protein
LVRVTRFPGTEPYFGKGASCRFDDPLQGYGVCYAGEDLLVAFAETILHDALPTDGHYRVEEQKLRERHVVTFRGATLALANMTGPPLKRLGAIEISSELPYDMPQLWSRAIYTHPQDVDGIQYVSRHINTGKAFALFDRCRARLATHTSTRLLEHPQLAEVIQTFGVDLL